MNYALLTNQLLILGLFKDLFSPAERTKPRNKTLTNVKTVKRSAVSNLLNKMHDSLCFTGDAMGEKRETSSVSICNYTITNACGGKYLFFFFYKS